MASASEELMAKNDNVNTISVSCSHLAGYARLIPLM